MIWEGGKVWPVTYMYVKQKSNGNASFCFCSIWVLSDKRHLDYFRGLFLASHVFCLPILYARPREVELWHWFCTVQGCLYLWQIVLSGTLKWQIKLQGHRHKSIAGFRRKSCRWKTAHCLLEGMIAEEDHNIEIENWTPDTLKPKTWFLRIHLLFHLNWQPHCAQQHNFDFLVGNTILVPEYQPVW